jgi:succinate dehydrogenase/fumarate reductase cytochrome b subunit
MPDIVQWRTNKNIIKWKIVAFCSVLLLFTHILIGVFFIIIKADPIPMILRNTALVGINACVEILFAYMILKYRFI